MPVSAAVATYTNRAAFERALGSFTVDDFTGVTAASHSLSERGDYTITSSNMYGYACGAASLGGSESQVTRLNYLIRERPFVLMRSGLCRCFGSTESGAQVPPAVARRPVAHARTLGGVTRTDQSRQAKAAPWGGFWAIVSAGPVWLSPDVP